jgi:hypothetical protein
MGLAKRIAANANALRDKLFVPKMLAAYLGYMLGMYSNTLWAMKYTPKMVRPRPTVGAIQ